MKRNLTPQQREEMIAEKYYYGEGHCEMDLIQAMNHYKAAMRLGSASACSKIGRMYDTGKGVPIDTEMAVEYYKAGAKRKDPLSTYYLMQYYFETEQSEHAMNAWRLLIETGDSRTISMGLLSYLRYCREFEIPRSLMDTDSILAHMEDAKLFWEDEHLAAESSGQYYFQSERELLNELLEYYTEDWDAQAEGTEKPIQHL